MVFTVPLAAAAVSKPAVALVAPALILVLCIVAGVGTTMLLPGHGKASLRRAGGAALGLSGLVLAVCIPSLLTGVADAVYFWIFSAIALASAVRVVTHPRPVYSALYFVLTVFASAGLFVLMQAEFMAAALVLIYAGAILVTYVFVIMLASQATGVAPGDGPPGRWPAYDATAASRARRRRWGSPRWACCCSSSDDRAPNGQILPAGVGSAMPTVNGGSTEGLGVFLFRSQSAQLEMAGVILLVSMVGAIVISRRQVLVTPEPGETKAEAHPPKISSRRWSTRPATPTDDNPHSIPVHGTDNPRREGVPADLSRPADGEPPRRPELPRPCRRSPSNTIWPSARSCSASASTGFLCRRNLIVMFLCTELMFQGVAINLIAFGRYHGNFWPGRRL